MAHHEVLDTNPKKEILTALIGIVLLLVVIGGIAVFAWLRPAGDRPAVAANAPAAEVVNSESLATAPSQNVNAGEAGVVETATTTETGASVPPQSDATTPPAQ